jgi:hypothetical protein
MNNRILTKVNSALCCAAGAAFLALALQSSTASAQTAAASGTFGYLTVTGTVDAQGEVDIRGNVLTLGSLAGAGTSSVPGISLTFADGTASTPSLLRYIGSRPLQEWRFEHPPTSGATSLVSAMKLDAQHRLILSDTTNNNTPRIVLDPSATGAQITINNDPVLTQSYASSHFMPVLQNGRVGIGTTNPTATLSVKTPEGNAGYPDGLTGLVLDRIYSQVGDYQDLTFGSGDGANPGGRAGIIRSIAVAGAETGLAFYTQSWSTVGTYDAADHEAMRILGNGYVGIGTANPIDRLTISNEAGGSGYLAVKPVYGPAYMYGQIPDSSSYAQTAQLDENGLYRSYFGYIGSTFGDSNSAGNVELGSNGADITIRPNEMEVMRFTQGGNVGIGTTSPQARFHVAGKGRFDDTVRIEERGDLSMGDFAYDPEPLQEQQPAMSQGLQVGEGAAEVISSGMGMVSGVELSGTTSIRPGLSGTTPLR